MKNIIFILSALFLIGCSKDDEPVVKKCDCDKLIQQKTVVVNNQSQVVSDTGWLQVSSPVQTDIIDCNRNNEVVFNTYQSNSTTILYTRHVLECK